MKKAPKVLTRMRLSCCWGDNLNVKELNDVVDYINELERQCKKQKQLIDIAIKYILKETKSMPVNGCTIRLKELLDILKGGNSNETTFTSVLEKMLELEQGSDSNE